VLTSFLLRFFQRLAWSLALVAGGLGCSPKNSAPADVATQRLELDADRPGEPPVSGGPIDVATFVAEIQNGSVGPRLALTKLGKVMVWAEPTSDGSKLKSAVVHKGKSAAFGRVLVDVDSSARQLELGKTNTGQLLASLVHKTGQQDALTVTRLGPEGELLASPVVVVATPGTIIYTRIVPSPLGALVIWVERTGDAADLYVAALEHDGPTRPSRIARGVTAWQVGSFGEAALVVTREGKTIVLRQFGSHGDVIGSPVELARQVTGGADLDVAMSADQILVAWTQKGLDGARLKGTVLDASGNVLAAPLELTPPRGEQVLLGVAPFGSLGTFQVMWQEPRFASFGAPSVFLGTLDPTTFRLQPEMSVRAARRDPFLPLLAQAPQGTSVITDVMCSQVTSNCATGSQVSRAAVFIPDDGGPPLAARLQGRGFEPSMVWDLTCGEGDCAFLFAENTTPTRVSVALAFPQGTAEEIAAPLGGRSPRLLSYEPLGDVPELTRLVAVPSDDEGSSLLSWVSYFDPDQPYVVPSEPAPDGRRAPVRAVLQTVHVPYDSPFGGRNSVISYRARSPGGVALVAPEKGRGLVVWSALDENVPQVFATLVDGKGVRISQKMLTNTPGEVSDVAAVRVNGGYLLSWVDGQTGNPEIFALFVNEALIPLGKPRQISEGASSPTGVALLSTAHGVHCVWSDARNASRTGSANLFSALLSAATAERVGPEKQLMKTEGHVYSPQLLEHDGGEILLSWLEEPTEGAATQTAAMRMATLDVTGTLASQVQSWEAPGAVSDMAIHCRSKECSAVLVVATSDVGTPSRVSLWGVSGTVGAASVGQRAHLLLPLETTLPEGVSPTIAGENLFFSDQSARGANWRLHRAEMQWGGAERPPKVH
jgi:hypothetical protein